MSTKKARDYLDKELFVKRDIVTFRSLSRELGIHVNDAKNELQFYYDAVRATDAPAVPTYLISGEVQPLTISSQSQRSEDSMDMDMDMVFDEDREEDVAHQTKVLLVDARALDDAKSQFSCIYSVHVYSLSPSRFRDPSLVCTPSFKVHNADAKGGLKSFAAVGKITGSHVKLRARAFHQSAASSSRTTLDAPARAPPKVAAATKAEPQTTKGKASSSDVKGQASATLLQKSEYKDKPKASGKLDWSKAKTKEKEPVAEKKKEDKKPKVEPDSPVVSGDAQKRGTKRKPAVNTDLESESESSMAKAKPSIAARSSVKKWVAYEDEDEDEDEDDDGGVRMLGLRRPKRKSTATSDSEMSLRAMMDIDDERVDRVSRVSRVLPQREEEEESEEEILIPEKETTAPPVTTEDEESDHVPVAPRRKKPRKVVPVGRNGLKKRRVVKSRTTTDPKGYMQTEDYSSYESVEEEEEEEEKKPKGKGKTKKASEPNVKDEARPKVVANEESGGKVKAKPSAKSRGGAPKRGGLLNFFGPERGKK